METRIGVCNLCEAICGLELTIEAGTVTTVRGNDADPLSRGHICPKGVAIADIYTDPDRLKHPVKRTADGWQEIGWDEAFDLVADNLAKAVKTGGRDAIGTYLGNPNVHSLGAMTHGVEFSSQMRSKNLFSATSVDQLPHQILGRLLFGHQLMVPIPDIDRTSYFLVFGANPMASNGSLMTIPDFPNRLRELKARGGSMVVFDPRRTETAKVATEHVFIRPGTDAWVLLAMLNTLFAEGLTGAPSYVDGLDAVAETVAPFTPERAELASGVSAEVIRRVARELAAADRAAAYGRMGVSTNPFGTVCQWALQMINIVTGNLDREGGMMFTSPAIDIVGRKFIGRGHHGKWASRVRGLPESNGELPVSVMREEIETPGKGQIKAMIVSAGNPVLSTPDGAALDRALETLDFMVAIDIYVNETSRHANVILPPTSALERDHYDLVFHAFAVRDTARFTPAIFPKGKDQRHDWEIYRELSTRLASRLGMPLRKRLTSRARMSLSPARAIALLLRTGKSGVTMKQLRANPAGVDLGPLKAGQLPARLQTSNKRIDAAPQMAIDDLVRLSAQQLPVEGELLLIGRRHQRDCNSWMHNTERLTRGRDRHQLLMNPGDLASRSLSDGGLVTVTSRVGTIKVEVLATDDVMPGVVSLPHGYGHQRGGTQMNHAATVTGVSINDLTDPELLDISGNAAFNGVPVTVTG